jgi:hypothetical protein
MGEGGSGGELPRFVPPHLHPLPRRGEEDLGGLSSNYLTGKPRRACPALMGWPGSLTLVFHNIWKNLVEE